MRLRRLSAFGLIALFLHTSAGHATPVDPGCDPRTAETVAALVADIEAALLEKRTVYQTLIDSHTTTIATLETEVNAIGARIQTKTAEAQNLINQQSRLISAIKEKQGMVTWLGMTTAAASFVTFGLASLAGGGAIVAATAAIAGYQSQLRDVERRESGVKNDLRALQASSAAFQRQQAELRQRLTGLKAAQAALEAARQTPTSTLAQLQHAAEADQKLIANLMAQIVALQAMRASAVGHEAALDRMIAALNEGVTALTNQLARTNIAVAVGLIDVALTGFGVSNELRLGGLVLARKQLLTAGIDLVRGDPSAVASTVVSRLVSDGLIAATGSGVLASTIATVLQVRNVDSRAAVATLVAGAQASGIAARLTSTQTELLTALANETRFDVEPLAKAVLAEPGLDDKMAHTILAMLRT